MPPSAITGTFWADAAAAYRAAIGHIAAAGCTYLQLDDVSFAYLCDPKVREALRAAGDDPAPLPRAYADVINAALRDRIQAVILAYELDVVRAGET